METANEVKQIAAQLLSGMLANPHIYASIGEADLQRQQAQELTTVAIAMAETLISKVNAKAI